MTDAPDFTPNPDRAIWVEGRLDSSLLNRLKLQIVALVQQNRSPITVFIDSRGGYADVVLDHPHSFEMAGPTRQKPLSRSSLSPKDEQRARPPNS